MLASEMEEAELSAGLYKVANDVSNHGSNAKEGASARDPDSDGSGAEKQSSYASVNRRSTLPESALDILEQTQTANKFHPIHWRAVKKWIIVFVYCLLQVFVTMTSTSYVSVEFLIMEQHGGSSQVVTLGQSLFIVGNAVGPAFLGPLSDIGGRKWIYVVSISLYAILNIGSALAVNLPMLIVFQFLCGAAGSTALSNVAGTIADLFGDLDGAGQPMALFVAAATYGPSIGSPVGEWVAENESMGLPWIFWLK